MKCQVVFPACLLLLWTLAVFVSAQETPKITTLMTSDGIKLKCGTDGYFKKDGQNHPDILQYNDENSGEYTCWTANPANEDGERKGPKIFVRFRTCDNCIELDIGSVVGMVCRKYGGYDCDRSGCVSHRVSWAEWSAVQENA
uniref:Uncharacterized protein n=1 Tax=Lates calcarifer TaxID=8187 RepID=A0A4W6DVR0_LATCA